MSKNEKANRDNRANQLNPNNSAYHDSRKETNANRDNRANQLNPNNSAYDKSRGNNTNK